MLAGVSHDLRTPLTRLKLQLAMMDPSDEIEGARADLDDMSKMLDEYLAFASGEEGERPDSCSDDLILAEPQRRVVHSTSEWTFPSPLSGLLLHNTRTVAVELLVFRCKNTAHGQQ